MHFHLHAKAYFTFFSVSIMLLLIHSTILITSQNRNNQYKQTILISDQDNTPIILGVIIPIILIVLLFITIIIIRRRRSAGRKATESRVNDSMSLPDSVIETSRPVRIDNFANHYRMMSADSDFR